MELDQECIHPCPCCGAPNQMRKTVRSFDICHVCGWFDDGDRDSAENSNHVTLSEAKGRWERGGAVRIEPPRTFPCPCCGAENQMSEEEGSFDICRICGWEDDWFRDSPLSINNMTISEARRRWKGGETLFKNYPNPREKT